MQKGWTELRTKFVFWALPSWAFISTVQNKELRIEYVLKEGDKKKKEGDRF